MRKQLEHIFKFVAIVLFASYFYGSALSFHTHHFSWGEVTHSHPFAPAAHHSHTPAECALVASLTLIVGTVGATFSLRVFARVATLLWAPQRESFASHLTGSASLRAPPVFVN